MQQMDDASDVVCTHCNANRGEPCCSTWGGTPYPRGRYHDVRVTAYENRMAGRDEAYADVSSYAAAQVRAEEALSKIPGVRRIDHSACDHPATKADRYRCRVSRAS